MRLIRLIIAFACLAVGAILGALNRDLVSIDFAAAQVTTTLGVALIVALLSGVLLGGLAIAASVVLPLRRRLGRLERQAVPRASAAPRATLAGDEGGR
ncbi:lipopolysaccharide assembly protein LapA domain-containing protein [Marilutibacter aestuarii]|nr:lipopolysaccharide assembly protein LapA domain-containing protein [Lysobacter aestuarii]